MYVLLDPCGSDPDKARLIRAYRSLFFLFYKLEIPFTPEQLELALRKWKECEEELSNFDYPSYYSRDLITARLLIDEVFCVDESYLREIEPRHGPGAVAGGEVGDEKWETASYIPSLHSVYPRYDLYFGYRSAGRISPAMAQEILAFTRKSPRVEEAVSRLLFVPKDSRGPRTISCEPKELMFVQQGMCRKLMSLFHNRTHGRINFVDQKVNGSIALASSQSGEFATIDLQDASDRVSTKLVDLLFPQWTLKYLHALRSTSTRLPDGSLFRDHSKFAPMGSAICFPIESLVFWSLAVTAGINIGMSVTDAKASTYVYGDDIIIKPAVFPELVRLYERLALKVNVSKSYVDGPFRESCGVDAWKGINVTPLKIKKDISRRSPDGALAAAMCDIATRCFSLDYRKTGDYVFNLVNAAYPGIAKIRGGHLGCLHVVDPLFDGADLHEQLPTKWDPQRCCARVKGWVLTTPTKATHLDGLSRLLKNSYGAWDEHDPSQVAVLRAAKIRKRNILVELLSLC
jgi:hypothetical protein